MFLRTRHTDKSDEELVRLYRTNQRLDWLSTVYLRYASLVYGVCLKYLRNRDDAQDAVMEIHEKLITSLLRHDVSNFRGWLHVFARNHCLMILRSKKGKPLEEITPDLMENGQSLHPEEDVMLVRDNARLEQCLKGLAEPQQQCVTLFYLEDKCYKEITAITGFDHNQVKSYIQNGKRNLKQCIEQHA